MSWITHSLPGDEGPWGTWHHDGHWLTQRYSSSDLASSTDLDTWGLSTIPGPGAVVYDAASDGTNWYIVGDTWAAKSTDGMTAAAWSLMTMPEIYVGYPRLGGFAVTVTPSGRILVFRRSDPGYSAHIISSDDGGATWTHRADTTGGAYADFRCERFYQRGSTIVLVSGSYLYKSADDGATWSLLTNPYIGSVRSLAMIAAGWMTTRTTSAVPRVSTDNGVTWSDSSLPADIYICKAWGGRVYLYRKNDPNPQIMYTADFVTFDTISTASFPPPYLTDIILAPGKIIAEKGDGYAGDGLYEETIPADLPEPIEPETITLPLSITISSNPGETISLPLRVVVAAAESIALPLSVSILDAAAFGGLDGAGGWPACPSGVWSVRVTLAGADVPSLIGQVTVTHARRAAATAKFAFMPSSPVLPTAVLGRPVGIAFVDSGTGATHMLYTGLVHESSIDLDTGIIHCTCSNALQESIASMSREAIDAVVGGSWHAAAFSEPADSREYLEQRIRTVTADYALDVGRGMRRLDWYGASLRAATVKLPDYFDRTLKLTLPTFDSFVTRCTVKAEYRYTRIWRRGALAQWSQPVNWFLPYRAGGEIQPGKVWLLTSMVESAASSVPGWTMQGTLSVQHPPARAWNIGTALTPAFYIITAQKAVEYACGFSASYAARWTQTATEYYEITLVAPAFESAVGRPIASELGATLTAEFEQPAWDADVTVGPFTIANPAYAGGSYIGAIGDPVPRIGDKRVSWQPDGAAPADRDAMISCLLDQARALIIGSGRSGRVSFELPLRPDIWLDWHITVDSTRLLAAGAVESVAHTLDPDAGTAISSIELAVGLPGSTSPVAPGWSIPEPTDPTPATTLSDLSFKIGSYVGNQAGVDPFDEAEMVGFVTNIDTLSVDGVEYYPHQLTMDSPEIRAEHRDPVELPASANIEIDIYTDTLELR